MNNTLLGTRRSVVTALLATAQLLPSGAWAGALAEASARVSPVQVSSCRVASELLSTDVDHPAEMVAGRLWFRLKNTSPVAATEVTLRIKYGGQVQTLVERGVFSNGARVDRTSDATMNANWAGSRPEACTVVAVRFADGAAWMPGNDVPLGSG